MRRTHLRPAALAVVRTLLVADAILLAAVGLICFLFVDGRSGVLLGIGGWVVAAMLFSCLPLTNPYRHERDSGWKW